MSITLVATPGSLSANTYATLAEAETYMESVIFKDAWTTATTANKTAALVQATRLLDSVIDWMGAPSDPLQALRWPRVNAYNRDLDDYASNAIPAPIRDATAEYAFKLLATDRTGDPDTQGFSDITVGPIKLGIDKRDQAAMLPDSVWALVSHLGVLQDPKRAGGTAKLVRT